ncbi:MAG: riboflavin synthase family protein, partial [Planctomycetota bacterium]
MFTGIIQAVGNVTTLGSQGEGARLIVEAGDLCEGVRRGDSVAVSGVCLTAAAIRPPRLEFDVNRETLERTTLHAFRPGRRVNLEKALSVGDPLGGPFVQGHVDGVGQVLELARAPGATMLRVSLDKNLALFLVE